MLDNVPAKTLDRSLLDTDEKTVAGLPYPLEIGITLGHARSDSNQRGIFHTHDGISETHRTPSYTRNAAPFDQPETLLKTR